MNYVHCDKCQGYGHTPKVCKSCDGYGVKLGVSIDLKKFQNPNHDSNKKSKKSSKK